jgi:hypothetical protein
MKLAVRIIRPACALVALSLVAGCAYTSLISPTNSKSVVQASAASSEQTYRTMLPVLRECFPTLTAIESNYFPDAKEGEIMVARSTDNVRIELAKMTISPAGTGSTVTMMRHPGFDKLDAVLPAWVNGKDGGCPYGTRVEPPMPTHNPYGTAASR